MENLKDSNIFGETENNFEFVRETKFRKANSQQNRVWENGEKVMQDRTWWQWMMDLIKLRPLIKQELEGNIVNTQLKL